MKELLRSTTAYRLFAADAARGSAAHTTLVVFSDGPLLRALLKECAKAFFAGERESRLIDAESYSDCVILPAAGEKYTVETAERIIEESLLRPVEGDKKLFVLDGFGEATPLVQNKLLKVLEEPPAGVYFLLGALSEHAILPTVLSRAKRFSVEPFREEAILGALTRNHAREEGLQEAAAASGGSYSAAEAILAGGGEEFRLAEEFLTAPSPEAFVRAMGDRKEKKQFFAAVKTALREALFLSLGREEDCFLKRPALRNIAREYPAGALISAIRYTGEAERDIQFNSNFGQAALALAIRIREEKLRWQKLS